MITLGHQHFESAYRWEEVSLQELKYPKVRVPFTLEIEEQVSRNISNMDTYYGSMDLSERVYFSHSNIHFHGIADY